MTTYYWCRACNRCLKHWRSAFCETHRAGYKKSRRRHRENTTNDVGIDRDVLAAMYSAATGYAEARHESRNTQDEDVRRAWQATSRQHLKELIQLVSRVPDYL